MKKIFPLPEAIDGHKWQVDPGAGSINTVERQLFVPLSDSDADRHIRNHETAHAKITPRHSAISLAHKYEISYDSLQVCEDLRVHKFLRKADIARPGTLSQDEMDRLVRKSVHSLRQIALLLIAGYHTDDFPRAVTSLETVMAPEALAAVVDHVHLIDKRMDAGRSLYRPIGFRNATAPAARLLDALYPEEDRGATDSDSSAVPTELLKTVASRSSSRAAKWGSLTIEHLPHPMSRRIVPASSSRMFRDEGSTLAAPYRLPVDGRVFVRHKRVMGGSVLIDGSGSMSLGEEDLRAIVMAAPATTIAIYCGTGSQGSLTKVAGNGRIADQKGIAQARSAAGNIVDGPALQWLAKQQEPRLWVSDGLVTGCHDKPSVDLWAEATLICRTHNIRRVEKAAAVKGFLTNSASR